MAKKKWIQDAIRMPGAMHKQMGIPMGMKIPAPKLKSAAKGGGVLAKRANLAMTLKGFTKGSKRKGY